MRKIARLVENLLPDEVAVHADEVDIHLNPKIGLDWMLPGQQKEVLTPVGTPLSLNRMGRS